MNAHVRVNHFERLWLAGYRRLVPVIPPGAPISERSSLFRALNKGPERDPRGKAVGIRGSAGEWLGFDWVRYESDGSDVARWHGMGAGVGVKTGAQPDGTWLLGIDADTLDEAQAVAIHAAIVERFGDLAVRIGRAPKALYLIRTAEPFQYTRIEFEQGDGKPARVEILSDGRQFVAEGVHPVTQRPYAWPGGTPEMARVPLTAPEALHGLLAGLQGILPACKPMVVEGAAADVDQATLRGDAALIRKAVEATPNTPALFPEREDYLHFGYAIKAALPDDEPAAFAMFSDWCDKYVSPDGELNDAETVASDWRRMKPPYKRGADYVFRLAEEHSGGAFSRAADMWFEPQTAPEPANEWAVFGYDDGSPIGEEPAASSADPGARETSPFYELLSLHDLSTLPKPAFVIGRHIPENSLGFLYGPPGGRKSFIALDWALHIAFDRSTWNGDAIMAKPGGTVIYLTGGEGTSDMFQRASAWMQHHNVPDMKRGRFRMVPRGVNFLKEEEMAKLAATLKDGVAGRVSLIVVDTISRAMPGADENLQKEMTLFVQNCDRLKSVFDCPVLGVHHESKAGGMRGSTVLLGAGDYVFNLTKPSPTSATGVLKCEKQKAVPDGWTENYRFGTVTLPSGESSLVPVREGGVNADEAAAAATRAANVVRGQAFGMAALAALGDDLEMPVSKAWAVTGQKLREAGLTSSTERRMLTDLITGELAGQGAIVDKAGVSMRVWASKGGGLRSSWVLSACPA